MKKLFLLLLMATILFQSNCTNEVEIDPQQDLYGYYNFTIQYATFQWGYGYQSKTKTTIGKVEKFAGFDGSSDIIDKIGILLDTADVQMITAKSCYDSLLFRYVNYYHPTINSEGDLDYPEFLCHTDFPITQFEGTFINDSLKFNIIYGDTIRATKNLIVGIKIN